MTKTRLARLHRHASPSRLIGEALHPQFKTTLRAKRQTGTPVSGVEAIQTAIFDSEIYPLKQRSTSLSGCRQRS
jgi:hypothetical protein